jgi:hypothetical protein
VRARPPSELVIITTIVRAHIYSLLPLSFISLLVLLNNRKLATTTRSYTHTGAKSKSTGSPSHKEQFLSIGPWFLARWVAELEFAAKASKGTQLPGDTNVLCLGGREQFYPTPPFVDAPSTDACTYPINGLPALY